jgi:1,2-diacylglycerol-3-alpha-glucose alpha-1,2-galactosyltransferase
MKKLKLGILAEDFIGEANGVTTAFLEAVDALKKEDDIELVVNEKDMSDCDVIHSHTIGLQYVKDSRKYKGKLVVSAHVVPDSFIGSLIFSKLWQPLAKMYLKYVYSLSDMVVAVSPMVKEELEKINVKSDIKVLCNSVDREKFKPDPEARKKMRKKFGIADDAFVAICVGQIQPRKGVLEFIETAKKCPDVTFLWVGGRPYGRLTEDYAHMTKEVENAPKNCLFPGIIDFEEMPGAYAAADVYFLPSLQENFAFATIEGASVRLPLVLRDNIEYPSSLFTHYLKGKDENEYAQVIQKLYEDKAELEKWQKESDDLANKYEIKAYIKTLKEYYYSFLK